MSAPAELQADGRRGFRRGLAALIGYGALSQAFLLSGAFRANPYALAPVLDAKHYWDWAGRIASGALVSETPFYSAPLYPYLVGLVRALGGGLVAVAVGNALLLIGAACLVALVGRRIVGGGAGAFAGMLVLWSCGLETAYVLAGPLQLFCVALVLERGTAPERGAPRRKAWTFGAALGALTLAWPAMLPGVFVLALFSAWLFRVQARGNVRAALWLGAQQLGAALLVIAPATLHNFVASGEWITVSAHGGITFWHGNNPLAEGVLAISEVENTKDTYHLDALRRAREALGPDAGWSQTSRFFFEKGLAWWGADPVHASGVALKKLWYTLSSRVYGDVNLVSLEVRDGLVPYHWFAPLPVAWFTPLGLAAALALAWRRPRVYVPVALLVALPCVVCVVFWYSPRYRLPAVPGLALASAAALGALARGGLRPSASASVLALAALGVCSGALNRWVGFDAPGKLERLHLERTAASLGGLGEHARAADLMARATALEPNDADLRQRTYLLLRALGRELEAVALLDAAPPETQRDPKFRAAFAWLLATSPVDEARDGARALALIDEVLAEVQPADGQVNGQVNGQVGGQAPDPAFLDVQAAAFAELRRFPAALEALDRALQWTRAGDPRRAGMSARLDAYRRAEPWREGAAALPELEGAHD
ncbi:MAG: tetratricopeptide repeat protein [Planctomycetota bacterium]